MSDVDPRRNLELKARLPDLDTAREAVRQIGARPGSTERQTDTYFLVPHGRLKLRQIEGQPALLIAYHRPDISGVRSCDYHLLAVDDPAAIRALLATCLGERGQVRKCREIWFWHNVRIHLDDVADLGSFIEFEAVLSQIDDEPTSQARLDRLCEVVSIDPSAALAPAYADLLGF